MNVELLTKDDLQAFRAQLLADLKVMLSLRPAALPTRPWLKNKDVMKLLNISANTVQRLRISGRLKSSKVGGAHYYRYEDVEELLNTRS